MTSYPILVPSANFYRIGEYDGYWYGHLLRFNSADDRKGITVKVCLHRHTSARTATACAERSGSAIIRHNKAEYAKRVGEDGQ
jgi:hypothetical protein